MPLLHALSYNIIHHTRSYYYYYYTIPHSNTVPYSTRHGAAPPALHTSICTIIPRRPLHLSQRTCNTGAIILTRAIRKVSYRPTLGNLLRTKHRAISPILIRGQPEFNGPRTSPRCRYLAKSLFPSRKPLYCTFFPSLSYPVYVGFLLLQLFLHNKQQINTRQEL
jgi:hypothetical protein